MRVCLGLLVATAVGSADPGDNAAAGLPVASGAPTLGYVRTR